MAWGDSLGGAADAKLVPVVCTGSPGLSVYDSARVGYLAAITASTSALSGRRLGRGFVLPAGGARCSQG